MFFSSQNQVSGSFMEGSVMAVDIIRHVCQVRTLSGKLFNNVPWVMPVGGGLGRNGLHGSPIMGERVLLSTALGYPIIVGSLPRSSSEVQVGTSIGGSPTIDTGNYSTLSKGLTQNPGKPDDLLQGDQVLSSESGAFVGALGGGSVILKASGLAQLFLSRIDDLGRIVARNWEVFTDTYMDVSSNIKGRIYRFVGYSNDQVKSRDNKFNYYEIHGDTAIGEQLSGVYQTGDLDNLSAKTDILKKKVVIDHAVEPPVKLYEETLSEKGILDRVVQKELLRSHLRQSESTWTVDTTDGSVKAVITIQPTSITLVWNDKNKIVLDANQILADFGGQSQVLLNGSKGEMSFGGSSTATVDSAQAALVFGGHFVKATASGVQLG